MNAGERGFRGPVAAAVLLLLVAGGAVVPAAGATVATADATFEESVVAEERGDTARIALRLTDTDEVVVTVGSDDIGYESRVRLRDADGDGRVAFTVNTVLAGRGEADEKAAGVYRSATDTVVSAERLTAQRSDPIPSGSYELEAAVSGEPLDVAILSLAARSSDGVTVFTLPGGAGSDDVGSLTLADLRAGASRRDRIAAGDIAVFQVEVSGVHGYVRNRSDIAVTDEATYGEGDGEDRPAAVSVTEVKGVSRLRDLDAVQLLRDPGNDTLYLAIDTDSHPFDAGGSYEFGFLLPVSNPYVDAASEAESVTSEVEVVERRATFDTRDGSVVVRDRADQRVTGTTTLAPGTEFRVQLIKRDETPFLYEPRATVQQDGTFEVAADFSGVAVGSTFNASIPNQGFADDARTPGVVRERPQASVSFDDQRTDGETVVVASADLSDGGFVTVHDGTLDDGSVFGSVRGTSGYLAAGSHEDIRVVLDEPIRSSGEFVAMAHLDTDGDERYDFVSSEGEDDGPYVDEGSAVTDRAVVSVSTPAPSPTPTATATPERTPTPTAPPTGSATTTVTATAAAGAGGDADPREDADTPVPGDGSTALVTGVPNEAVGGGLLLLLAGGAWVLARRTGETTDAGPEVTVTTTGADGDGGATSDTADGGDAPTGGTDGGPGDDETPDGDEPSTGDADTAAVAAGGASGASDEDDAAAETGRSTGADGPPDSIPTAGSLDLSFEDLERGECLGGGGSADVYRATTPDGTELALKLPRFHGTLHRETMEQFTKEAETWAKLDDHEAVVGVHDWGTSPKPWLALEYMAGGPLDARAGSLSHRQATWTALQIVEGVRHAHEHGIAHLDLKPANVLFREVGDGWDAPKVADWGLARLLLEESGSVEGLSPSYAAPEQFDRDRFGEPGTATDIYQLGTVVYELFTGEPPVTGSGSEAMFSVLEDEVTPPTQVAAVPPALDDIVAQATAKQPAERYEAVYYLRDDLRDLYESL